MATTRPLVAQAVEQLGDPAGDTTLTLRLPDLQPTGYDHLMVAGPGSQPAASS